MSPNINNMKQAVFEMFGVGSGGEVTVVPAQVELVSEELVSAPQTELLEANPAPIATPVPEGMRRVAMSYIAAGTVFEGTLHCDGDVEMAGEFIGDMDAKGTVKLFSSVEGNINAGSLTLTGCTLTGNATVTDTLTLNEEAKIHGNVQAREVRCAGQIYGDLNISGNATLERTAQVHGNIVTGSFAVAKGAVICGSLEIKGKGEK